MTPVKDLYWVGAAPKLVVLDWVIVVLHYTFTPQLNTLHPKLYILNLKPESIGAQRSQSLREARC